MKKHDVVKHRERMIKWNKEDNNYSMPCIQFSSLLLSPVLSVSPSFSPWSVIWRYSFSLVSLYVLPLPLYHPSHLAVFASLLLLWSALCFPHSDSFPALQWSLTWAWQGRAICRNVANYSWVSMHACLWSSIPQPRFHWLNHIMSYYVTAHSSWELYLIFFVCHKFFQAAASGSEKWS